MSCIENNIQSLPLTLHYILCNTQHIQFIIYQLLKALKFIHSAGLLHRDIKPSNILLDANCFIKLCDFGLCRSIAVDDTPSSSTTTTTTTLPHENIDFTDYIATRWYRCPEILVGSRRYSIGVDLWSVACIIGEMFRSRPLIAGASTMQQVEMIFELTGNPTSSDVESWHSPFTASILQNVQAKCRVSLDELCNSLPADAKALMKSLFKLNPSKRGTAATALEHIYLADFHDVEQEIVYPHGPIRIGISDREKLTANEYKNLLYSSIATAKKHEPPIVVASAAAATTLQQVRLEDDMDEELITPTVSHDSIDNC